MKILHYANIQIMTFFISLACTYLYSNWNLVRA